MSRLIVGRKVSLSRLEATLARAMRARAVVSNTRPGGESPIGTWDDVPSRFGARRPALPKAFQMTKQSGLHMAVLAITGGSIIVHGRGAYDVEATVLTMSCAPNCWIYVRSTLTWSGLEIRQAVTRQVSDSSEFRWPLLHFEYVNGRYVKPADGSPVVLHEGDIHIATVLR